MSAEMAPSKARKELVPCSLKASSVLLETLGIPWLFRSVRLLSAFISVPD